MKKNGTIRFIIGLIAAASIIFYSGCSKDEKSSCDDGIQNQGETGIDCGGPCPACPPPPGGEVVLLGSFFETGWDIGSIRCNWFFQHGQ